MYSELVLRKIFDRLLCPAVCLGKCYFDLRVKRIAVGKKLDFESCGPDAVLVALVVPDLDYACVDIFGSMSVGYDV